MFWAERQAGANRITQTSACLWDKCAVWGFGVLFGGIPVHSMLGEGPRTLGLMLMGAGFFLPPPLHPHDSGQAVLPLVPWSSDSCAQASSFSRAWGLRKCLPFLPVLPPRPALSCLPLPPPSPGRPEGRRPLLPLASKDVLFPVHFSWG